MDTPAGQHHSDAASIIPLPHDPAVPSNAVDDHDRTAVPDDTDRRLPVERSVSVDALRTGMRLAHSLYDDRGVLLLAANSTITPRFMALLRQRKLTTVGLGAAAEAVPPTVIENTQSLLTWALDARLEQVAHRSVPIAESPWHTTHSLPPGDLAHHALEQLQHYEHSTASFECASGHLLQGAWSAMDGADGLLTTFIDSIALDLGIIPHLLALKNAADEHLYQHCINVSLLSMTIGAQMRYPRSEVLKLGLAALLHDLGMLKVDASIRTASRPLTPREYLQIKTHPIHTLNLLEGVHSVESEVLLAVYQVHERCDCSGYPHGRSAQDIHPFARVIAVADAYCAMTCPRPYRAALHPYHAIEAILGQTRLGSFDPAVIRALLDCLSLYPVGSCVLLNTDQRARVTRAIPEHYDRPVIAILDAEGNTTDEFIDLINDSDLRVVNILQP